MFEYSAEVLRVIDGDTLELRIDLGFHTFLRKTIRLLGVNCPEMKAPTRLAATAAKQFTEDWLCKNGKHVKAFVDTHNGLVHHVLVRTHLDKSDSFGRWLATIVSFDGDKDLVEDLLAAGHAVEYRDH